VEAKFATIAPYLDERQQRLWLGVEAGALGRGGVSAVARVAGAAHTTVTRAVKELDAPEEAPPVGRVGWGASR
jgi:hypothetical protein